MKNDSYIKEIQLQKNLQHKYRPVIRDMFAVISRDLDKEALECFPFMLYGLFEAGFIAGISMILKDFETELAKVKKNEN